MATKKRKKNSKRKAAVKLPLFVVILLIIAALVLAFLWWKGYLDIWLKPGDSAGGGTGDTPAAKRLLPTICRSILELGNKYTGDCTLIKVGDTEILVDAGSRQSSAKTITEYVSRYCTDGVLEYVIATHADQDHIAGFVGTSAVKGYSKRSNAERLSISRALRKIRSSTKIRGKARRGGGGKRTDGALYRARLLEQRERRAEIVRTRAGYYSEFSVSEIL